MKSWSQYRNDFAPSGGFDFSNGTERPVHKGGYERVTDLSESD